VFTTLAQLGQAGSEDQQLGTFTLLHRSHASSAMNVPLNILGKLSVMLPPSRQANNIAGDLLATLQLSATLHCC
jgi:hypothetical protein